MREGKAKAVNASLKSVRGRRKRFTGIGFVRKQETSQARGSLGEWKDTEKKDADMEDAP